MALSHKALQELSLAYTSGLTRPVNWRRKQLQGIHDLIQNNQDALVGTALDDKRLVRADVLLELASVLDLIHSQLDAVIGSSKPCQNTATNLLVPASKREVTNTQNPAGVVVVSSHWAFPYGSSLGSMVLAYAAGNVVALVPPTSRVSSLLATLLSKNLDLFGYAVISPEEVKAAALDVPSGPAMLVLEVGSNGAVEPIRSLAAPSASAVAYVNYLALGKRGSSPKSRAKAAKAIAQEIVQSKVVFNGQANLAPFIVYIDEEIFHEISGEFVAAAKTLATGRRRTEAPEVVAMKGVRTLSNGFLDVVEVEAGSTRPVDFIPLHRASTLVLARVRGPDAAIDRVQSSSRVPAFYLYTQEPFITYITKNVDSDRTVVNSVPLELLANPFAISSSTISPSLSHAQNITKSPSLAPSFADAPHEFEPRLAKAIAGATIERLDEGDGTHRDFFDDVGLVFRVVKYTTYASVAFGGFLAYRRFVK